MGNNHGGHELSLHPGSSKDTLQMQTTGDLSTPKTIADILKRDTHTLPHS